MGSVLNAFNITLIIILLVQLLLIGIVVIYIRMKRSKETTPPDEKADAQEKPQLSVFMRTPAVVTNGSKEKVAIMDKEPKLQDQSKSDAFIKISDFQNQPMRVTEYEESVNVPKPEPVKVDEAQVSKRNKVNVNVESSSDRKESAVVKEKNYKSESSVPFKAHNILPNEDNELDDFLWTQNVQIAKTENEGQYSSVAPEVTVKVEEVEDFKPVEENGIDIQPGGFQDVRVERASFDQITNDGKDESSVPVQAEKEKPDQDHKLDTYFQTL